MSHTLLFGFDEQLARWACARIPWMQYHAGMKAVGIADGDSPDADLLAVIVYHNFQGPHEVLGREWYNYVEVSFATASPRWATRRNIRNLLKIAFDQFKVRQVLLTIPSINEPAIRFVKGIGFTPRGTLTNVLADGVTAYVFGLSRESFRGRHFLRGWWHLNRRREKKRGQEHTISAAAA